MEDNKNIELDNANLDNWEVKQPETWDSSDAKWTEQEEKTVDLSWLKSKPKNSDWNDKQKKAKEWIINSYLQKVAVWEVEIDDVPEWARNDVSSQLESIIEPNTSTNNFSKDDIVAQAKAELKFEQKLDDLAWKYNQEQIDLITATFNWVKNWNPNIDQSEALDFAIFKLWLWTTKETKKQEQITNWGLPPRWTIPWNKTVYKTSDLVNMSDEQYAEIIEKRNRGEITIK